MAWTTTGQQHTNLTLPLQLIQAVLSIILALADMANVLTGVVCMLREEHMLGGSPKIDSRIRSIYDLKGIDPRHRLSEQKHLLINDAISLRVP